MKKQTLTSLAIGSAFAAVALTPVAHAADNPFAAKQLNAGYQLAQADTKGKEGKCGEGKCGAEKKAADKKKTASVAKASAAPTRSRPTRKRTASAAKASAAPASKPFCLTGPAALAGP